MYFIPVVAEQHFQHLYSSLQCHHDPSVIMRRFGAHETFYYLCWNCNAFFRTLWWMEQKNNLFCN